MRVRLPGRRPDACRAPPTLSHAEHEHEDNAASDDEDMGPHKVAHADADSPNAERSDTESDDDGSSSDDDSPSASDDSGSDSSDSDSDSGSGSGSDSDSDSDSDEGAVARPLPAKRLGRIRPQFTRPVSVAKPMLGVPSLKVNVAVLSLPLSQVPATNASAHGGLASTSPPITPVPIDYRDVQTLELDLARLVADRFERFVH